jgi:hypothetical protein
MTTRAYVNCRRCYELARSRNVNAEDVIEGEDIASVVFEEDRLYEARNEALRSLERATVSPSMSELPHDSVINTSNLLMACRNCDFARPYIAEIMDGRFDPNNDSESF